MAFNPFSGFRKHQKVFMAALVLIAMITFILTGTGGGADPLDWIARTLQMRSGPADNAVTLYGQQFTALQLHQLRTQRQMASTFMILATVAALDRQASAFMEKHKEIEQGLVKELQEDKIPQDHWPERLKAMRRSSLLQLPSPQTSRMVERLPPEIRFALQFRAGDRQIAEFAPRVQFFPGANDLQGLCDFLIWKHQADRLGIYLTDDAVKQEVLALTNNQYTDADGRSIVETMQKLRLVQSISFDQLRQALRDEFRVRLAQAALEGYEPGTRTQMPVAITPYEFWDYYRDSRTELAVALLEVPVDAFVPEVKEEPSDKELQDLFQRYRSVEPRPESETPGFRRPRRIQVQVVSGQADTPEYQRAAQLQAAVTQVTLPVAWNLKLWADYQDRYVQNIFTAERAPALTNPNYTLYYYRELARPGNVAGALGQLLGAAASGAPVLSAAVSYQAGAVAADRDNPALEQVLADQARLRSGVGATLLLEGFSPFPLTLPSLWAAAAEARQYLPFPLARKELVNQLQQEMARQLLTQNLRAVQKEVQEKGKRSDTRKELPQFLADAAARWNLTVESMKEPKSQYEIAHDEAVQQLREAALGPRQRSRSTDLDFAQFLLAHSLYNPGQMPAESPLWNSARRPMLFWLTADEPARTPSSLAQVRDEVVRAWKRQKARELARQKAQQLAEKARHVGADFTRLQALADDAKVHRPFVLDPVARLVEQRPPERTPFPTRLRSSYGPYQVPEDRVAYPGPDFVKELLKLKEQKPGETLVLPDQPKERFYLAVLLSVRPPTQSDFFSVYKADTSAPADDPTTLLAQFQREQREKYRKEFIEQLRQQAGLQIPDEFRRGFERESESMPTD